MKNALSVFFIYFCMSVFLLLFISEHKQYTTMDQHIPYGRCLQPLPNHHLALGGGMCRWNMSIIPLGDLYNGIPLATLRSWRCCMFCKQPAT